MQRLAANSYEHVMCEKPISVDVITTEEVLAKAASKPDLKLLIPFCRRCELMSILLLRSTKADPC